MADKINHPRHYTHGDIEAIDAIESWRLGYHLGNVVKYICRAGHKGDEIGDLQKAKWYLERHINLVQKRQEKQEQAGWRVPLSCEK